MIVRIGSLSVPIVSVTVIGVMPPPVTTAVFVIVPAASIGANATIVCGHTVGRWALIGAGAVVACNVPDHALMLGVPAKIRGWACECGALLHFDGETATCTACGRSYRMKAKNEVEECK